MSLSLTDQSSNQKEVGLTIAKQSTMAEKILALNDNPVIYDLTLKSYCDKCILTQFLSIVFANLSKVIKALTFITKECGSA